MAVSQWIVLTIIARMGGAEPLGEYAFALSICAPVVMLSNLGLRFFQATDVAENYKTRDYLSLRALCLTGATILIVIIAFQFDDYSPQIILLVALYKIFESCSDVLYGFFQKNGRMDIVGVSLTITAILIAILFSSAYWISESFAVGLLIMALARVVVLVAFDLRSFERMRPLFVSPNNKPSQLGGLAYTALPLGLVAVLHSFNVNIPRYFLAGFESEAAVGVFVALSYIIIAGVTVVNSLMHPLMPILTTKFLEADRSGIYRLLLLAIGFALICGVGGMLIAGFFSKPLLRIFYGDGFSEFGEEFFLLSVVGAVNLLAFTLQHVVTSLHKFRMQFVVLLTQFVFIVSLSIYWIPNYGISGAIFAWGGGIVAHVVCSLLVIANELRRLKAESRFY